MKYKLPQPSSDVTFDIQDTFQRKDLAIMLTNIIASATEPLVLSLEAQWGDGKTSFVYKWINYLKEKSESKRPTALYIDAYKNDFMSDPLLLLASEIYTFYNARAGNKAASRAFMDSVVKVSGAITKGIVRSGIHYVTGGIFSSSQMEKAEETMANMLSDVSDEVIQDAITSYEERRRSLDELSQSLTSLAEEIDPEMPLIVIIDELDRCRPAFALDLIEAVKHLFLADKVVFVLVNNPHQMEESVKAQYGNGVDAKGYLQKFYDLTFTLPKMELHDLNMQLLDKFVVGTISYFDEGDRLQSSRWESHISTLAVRKGLSLRDIQKLVAYIVVYGGYRSYLPVQSMSADMMTPILQVGLAYVALKDRKLLNSIYFKTAKGIDILSFLGVDMEGRSRDQAASLFDEVWYGFVSDNYSPEKETVLSGEIIQYRKHGSVEFLSSMAKHFIQFSID